MLGYVHRPGRARWDDHLRSVGRLWDEIRRPIDGLGLDDAHVRLYRDGLPVCDHEERKYDLNRRILGVDRSAAPRAGDPREEARRLPHV